MKDFLIFDDSGPKIEIYLSWDVGNYRDAGDFARGVFNRDHYFLLSCVSLKEDGLYFVENSLFDKKTRSYVAIWKKFEFESIGRVYFSSAMKDYEQPIDSELPGTYNDYLKTHSFVWGERSDLERVLLIAIELIDSGDTEEIIRAACEMTIL